MKILHTADIHLGVKNTRLPKEQQNLLKDEMLFNIRIFFEMANNADYETILICGDLFHSKTISSKISKAFFDAVEKFQKPVIYISGNHDENFVLPSYLPENFIVLDKNTTSFTLNDFKFVNQFYDFSLLNRIENNILLLHGNIENTRDSDYFDIEKYLHKGFDYIALGHIHQFKKYSKYQDTYAYPGCLFSNGFDESGEKGFISIEIEDKKITSLTYVCFPTRKFVVCESDVTCLQTNKEILDKINYDLNNLNLSNQDLIKVILKGSVSEDCEKSISFIKSRFDNFFYFEIEDKTTLKIDIEKIKKEKLSFKYEFISLVENSELDCESKRLVCEIGLEALKGEDINI